MCLSFIQPISDLLTFGARKRNKQINIYEQLSKTQAQQFQRVFQSKTKLMNANRATGKLLLCTSTKALHSPKNSNNFISIADSLSLMSQILTFKSVNVHNAYFEQIILALTLAIFHVYEKFVAIEYASKFHKLHQNEQKFRQFGFCFQRLYQQFQCCPLITFRENISNELTMSKCDLFNNIECTHCEHYYLFI